MSLKCVYHPDREASDKCEKCGKVICLECKMVYHETIHHGTGDNSYAYSRQFDLCPPCFYDRKIKKYGTTNMIGGIIGIIFIIIFIGVSQTMMNSPDMPSSFRFVKILLLIIPILMLIGIIIGVFIYGPIKVKDFKSKRGEFWDSIKPMASIQKEEVTPKFCIECGNRIDPDASICSYCGSTIKKKD
ncbi:MAG: zinc-ribbon domain-containing protein [Promethearchaeota archaeon]